jgi:hypothetical protein
MPRCTVPTEAPLPAAACDSPCRHVDKMDASTALRNGMSRHSYWHAILSAAKIRWSGPAGHGYPSTRPLCLPELCGASARWVVVSVQGIKPGRKKGLALAKRSHCFFGRPSPHGRQNSPRWLITGCQAFPDSRKVAGESGMIFGLLLLGQSGLRQGQPALLASGEFIRIPDETIFRPDETDVKQRSVTVAPQLKQRGTIMCSRP